MRSLALAFWLLAWPVAAQPHVRPVEVRVHPIERFHPFSSATRFGKLEFLGGVQVASADPLFGGWSGVRLMGERIVVISDAGYWFDARTVREGDRLLDLEAVRITPMLDGNGRPFDAKWKIDAEGFEHLPPGITGPVGVTSTASWLVSTERDVRLLHFDGDPFATPVPARVLFRPTIPLRGNRALEAVAARITQDAFLLLTLSEDSRDERGDVPGLLVDGMRSAPQPIAVRKRGRYAITAAAFLPDGDLLILERRFDLAAGPGMRIRRIEGRTIRSGAALDGDVLIEAALPHQIDNMEGLAVSPHPQGHRLTLVSDDNRSMLQRTLVLEFLLRR